MTIINISDIEWLFKKLNCNLDINIQLFVMKMFSKCVTSASIGRVHCMFICGVICENVRYGGTNIVMRSV